LDGEYPSGLTWTETYLADGRLDYRERGVQAQGNWHFRAGHVFCTFYDPPLLRPWTGACWTIIQSGANCYDLYVASLGPAEPVDDTTENLANRWNGRAWRKGEASTCMPRPSV
jgi:hypothetical protein